MPRLHSGCRSGLSAQAHLPVVVDAVVLGPRAVPGQHRRVRVAVPPVRTAPDGVADKGAQPPVVGAIVLVATRQCVCRVC